MLEAILFCRALKTNKLKSRTVKRVCGAIFLPFIIIKINTLTFLSRDKHARMMLCYKRLHLEKELNISAALDPE